MSDTIPQVREIDITRFSLEPSDAMKKGLDGFLHCLDGSVFEHEAQCAEDPEQLLCRLANSYANLYTKHRSAWNATRTTRGKYMRQDLMKIPHLVKPDPSLDPHTLLTEIITDPYTLGMVREKYARFKENPPERTLVQ